MELESFKSKLHWEVWIFDKKLGGSCKVGILFDDFEANAPQGNFVKNVFQNVSKSEKISEHEKKKIVIIRH